MTDDDSDKESVKTEEFAIHFEATMEPGGTEKRSPELKLVSTKEDEKTNLETPVSNFLSPCSGMESKIHISTVSASFKDKLNEFGRLRASCHSSNGIVSTAFPITLTNSNRNVERSNLGQAMHTTNGTPVETSRWLLGRWRTDVGSPATSVRPTHLGTPSTPALGSEAKETFRCVQCLVSDNL
ncbi:hypothetical protein FGIG_05470 [Fasciola gigantica]|uniref:Uncharacterized protein n=1 Tax=Fasciola gigantica TaxID=46835 RepID=A0A504YSS9_FASGI|nr:hypothetical protein FGIG_05470 [Fasciola gigantica]